MTGRTASRRGFVRRLDLPIVGTLMMAMSLVMTGRVAMEDSHAHHHHHDHAGREAAVVEAEIVDPVCGMRVGPDAPESETHEGRLYRFCSRNCAQAFRNDPGLYMKKS